MPFYPARSLDFSVTPSHGIALPPSLPPLLCMHVIYRRDKLFMVRCRPRTFVVDCQHGDHNPPPRDWVRPLGNVVLFLQVVLCTSQAESSQPGADAGSSPLSQGCYKLSRLAPMAGLGTRQLDSLGNHSLRGSYRGSRGDPSL